MEIFPFFLTADILEKITQASNPPVDTFLILQEEAARKYSGSPYGRERLVSLLIKPRFEPQILYRFKREDFQPAPRVRAAFLRLKLREKPLISPQEEKEYADFVTFGFSQWRPTIGEALKRIFTKRQLVRLSRDLGFDLRAKPSDLTFEQWLGLFRYFQIGVASAKKAIVKGAYRRHLKQEKKLRKIHRSRPD